MLWDEASRMGFSGVQTCPMQGHISVGKGSKEQLLMDCTKENQEAAADGTDKEEPMGAANGVYERDPREKLLMDGPGVGIMVARLLGSREGLCVAAMVPIGCCNGLPACASHTHI